MNYIRLKSALSGLRPTVRLCGNTAAWFRRRSKVGACAGQRRRGSSAITLFVALGSCGSSAHAAGTFAAFGVGGSWQPLGASSSRFRPVEEDVSAPLPSLAIRLVEQEIRVELPSRRVEVRSVFRNEGAATTLRIGLMESGDPSENRVPAQGFMRGFSSTLDGKPLSITRIGPQADDSAYHLLRVARVRFGRGQTRTVHDHFIAGANSEMMNSPEGGYVQRFDFDLAPAARWNGRVGHLRVVFDAKGLRDFSEIKFAAPLRKIGATYGFEARDVEPKSLLNASWWPGVRQFEIDGQTPLEHCVVTSKTATMGEYPAVYPHLVRGKIWVPLRLLQQWLPEAGDGTMAQIRMPPRRTFFNLKWGARELIAAPTSDSLDILREDLPWGEEKMNAPARFERGLLMVELSPAVRALGGEVVTRNGVTQLWMRKSPP